MSLKELASLAPWNWDPRAAKHPPKKAALQDFEKIESAWRHDEASQLLAPAPTPSERRRSSAACNAMEVGGETPNTSGLARKAASADRARSLLKRKAAELQMSDPQKQPPPHPRQAGNQTRARTREPDVTPSAEVPSKAGDPKDVLCRAETHGKQRLIASISEAIAVAAGTNRGSVGPTDNSWVPGNEGPRSANQTPAHTPPDLSMRPPKWTPAVVLVPASPLEPTTGHNNTPLAPVPHHEIPTADSDKPSYSEGVAAEVRLRGVSSAPVKQQGSQRAGSSDGRLATASRQTPPSFPTVSTPHDNVLKAQPAASATRASGDLDTAVKRKTYEHDVCLATVAATLAGIGATSCSATPALRKQLWGRSRGDGDAECADPRPAQSANDAAKNSIDRMPHNIQPGAHRRGDAHIRSGDDRPAAAVLATRLSLDGRTPYGHGSREGPLLSPASQQRSATLKAHVSQQLQLSLLSPKQPQFGESCPAESRGQPQQDLPPNQSTAACSDMGTALSPTGRGSATEDTTTRVSLLERAPATQCGGPSAVISSAPYCPQSSSRSGWAYAAQHTIPIATTPRVSFRKLLKNSQDIDCNAKQLQSSTPAINEFHKPGATLDTGPDGTLKDAMAGTPYAEPPPTAGKTHASGKVSRNDNAGVGLGGMSYAKQKSELPRSPLAARQESQAISFSPRTAGDAEVAGRKSFCTGTSPNIHRLVQKGAAAGAAAPSVVQASNWAASTTAAIAAGPRIAASSTTAIAGSRPGQENWNGSISTSGVLSKGIFQNLVASESTNIPSKAAALATSVADPKMPVSPGEKTAGVSSAENKATKPSAPRDQPCEDKFPDKGVDGSKVKQSQQVIKEGAGRAEGDKAVAAEAALPTTSHVQEQPLESVGFTADVTGPAGSVVSAHDRDLQDAVVTPAAATRQGGGGAASVVACNEPALPPANLTQQQLLVLDQLLGFFRATGCRHPSAMSAAELVAAISSFSQSAGIPVTSSNIQILASWLGALLALEKPVKAYAQAQACARAAHQTPNAVASVQQHTPQEQQRLDGKERQVATLHDTGCIDTGTPELRLAGLPNVGEDELAGRQRRGSCSSTPWGPSLQVAEEQRMTDLMQVTVSQQQQPLRHVQVQDPRCQPADEESEQHRLEDQQQRHQPLDLKHDVTPRTAGTLREAVATEAEGQRSSITGTNSGRGSLHILPLQPGGAVGPTPLETLSLEWSAQLSPAVTVLYERLTSCQQALRSALLSAAVGAGVPAMQPSSQPFLPSRSQRQASTGSASEPNGAAAAVATAVVLKSSAAGTTMGKDSQPRPREQQTTSYPQSAITQQLPSWLARQQQQQQQLIGTTAPKPGGVTPNGDPGCSAQTAATTTPAVPKASAVIPQAALTGTEALAWAQTKRTPLEQQPPAGMPDVRTSSAVCGGGGGGTSSSTLVNSAGAHQQDPRPEEQAGPPALPAVMDRSDAAAIAPAAPALVQRSRPALLHQMQTVATISQPYMQTPGSTMPAMQASNWSARYGQHQHWTGARGVSAAIASARAQVHVSPAAVNITGAAAAAPAAVLASGQWSAVGSGVVAAVAAPQFAQTPLSGVGIASAAKSQMPTQMTPSAAKSMAFPYSAYGIPGARALQFPPVAPTPAASGTPVPYPRLSGASSLVEDASMLQPSPVQQATSTGHTAAVPYGHSLRPYGYASSAPGHAWHYPNPYGWRPPYDASGRAVSAEDSSEPFAYSYTTRGAAMSYACPSVAAPCVGGAQGPVSTAVDFPTLALQRNASGLDATQQYQHLVFAAAKPGNRRAKPVGLAWNMHGYAAAAGQPYNHLPAGSYSAGGWAGSN